MEKVHRDIWLLSRKFTVTTKLNVFLKHRLYGSWIEPDKAGSNQGEVGGCFLTPTEPHLIIMTGRRWGGLVFMEAVACCCNTSLMSALANVSLHGHVLSWQAVSGCISRK